MGVTQRPRPLVPFSNPKDVCPCAYERNLFNDLEKGLQWPWTRPRTQKCPSDNHNVTWPMDLPRLKDSTVVEF